MTLKYVNFIILTVPTFNSQPENIFRGQEEYNIYNFFFLCFLGPCTNILMILFVYVLQIYGGALPFSRLNIPFQYNASLYITLQM